jgi:hypothetical protein
LAVVEDNIPRNNASFLEIPFDGRTRLSKSSQGRRVALGIGLNQGSYEGTEEGQIEEPHLYYVFSGEFAIYEDVISVNKLSWRGSGLLYTRHLRTCPNSSLEPACPLFASYRTWCNTQPIDRKLDNEK